jgi:hypothetical protein
MFGTRHFEERPPAMAKGDMWRRRLTGALASLRLSLIRALGFDDVLVDRGEESGRVASGLHLGRTCAEPIDDGRQDRGIGLTAGSGVGETRDTQMVRRQANGVLGFGERDLQLEHANFQRVSLGQVVRPVDARSG